MFNKILIANRGEIAVRIIRACHEMNIKTVAVYSKADEESLHVQLADESICIGANSATESYLNIPQILSAAIKTNVEAIHPGFGMLSENAHFAELCEECGIKFIGPKSSIIEKLGNKANAKEIAKNIGIPVILDGGIISTLEDAINKAKIITYPVMIKASSGGGGKGMRLINNDLEMTKLYEIAKKEALNAFKDETLYIEKYIKEPKHIEIQIVADEHGNIIHLFERECSIQRLHQKIVEEAPSTTLNDKIRKKLFESAIKLAKSVDYTNVGTVEFLVSKDEYYFMEMNTRIQVEHPITEMITNVDIVKEQIQIAFGMKLSYKQNEIIQKGHAIELRINAQDTENNFMSSVGTIDFLHFPNGNGIRIDTHLFTGFKISSYYDSMLCKIIVYGETREIARHKANRALEEFVIHGCVTNTPYLYAIINDEEFISGEYTTTFLEKLGEKLEKN